MFCAYDTEEHIIAIHDKRKIVEKYVERIKEFHSITLNIGKVKDTAIHKVNTNDDLYLVRYADTYVQLGYLTYIELAQEQFIEDDIYARDVLYRILETGKLSKKEMKHLKETILIMERITNDDSKFTPSKAQLEELKWNYDPYLYNTSLYN